MTAKFSDRVIIHFDYDAFYASVVEAENPALKSLPLAIQQKQIVVTCNYEARRRGLRKLQLITEAKKVCPEVVIILGEDLTRFRNASKLLYKFLQSSIWSDRVERLGFDEVWLDCTDMVDYNYDLLNENDLEHSFFCLDRDDPTAGFEFDARSTFGPTYPSSSQSVRRNDMVQSDRVLYQRLVIGSHLARHLRHELEARHGYTATVGIAPNKLLSKLIGNVNKPHNQTTLMPPLIDRPPQSGSIHTFLDSHDIGKVPGIGFKMSNRIREYVLGRNAEYDQGLVYGGTKENVTVRDVRLHPNIGPDALEQILGGPGAPKGIGGRVWALVNGLDDAEVIEARRVPVQISQEDSYMKYLQTWDQVRQQLFLLAERLIFRMRVDLLDTETSETDDTSITSVQKWLAHPRTLRLSTRPRPPIGADGSRARSFNRISHSCAMPNFVFNLSLSASVIAEKLVETTLTSMFRKLHSERTGWNLSLINLAATNMVETAADSKSSGGRDIEHMFRHQESNLRDFRVVDPDLDLFALPPTTGNDDGDNNTTTTAIVRDHVDRFGVATPVKPVASDDAFWAISPLDAEAWISDDESMAADTLLCGDCGLRLPGYAMEAHGRYHREFDKIPCS